MKNGSNCKGLTRRDFLAVSAASAAVCVVCLLMWLRSGSTDCGSSWGTFSSAALTMVAARSSGRQSTSEPLLARPIGVRAVDTITASGIAPVYCATIPAVKFGLLPPYRTGAVAEPEWITRFAQHAEGCGFESVYTVEHVVVPAGYTSTYPYSPDGRMTLPDHADIPDPLDLLAFLAATVGLLGFRGSHFRKPPLYIFPDMEWQYKLRPQKPNGFFTNGISSQLPVAGTIARAVPIETVNGPVYPFEDSPVNTGRLPSTPGTTNYVELNPLPLTASLLQRGRQRFTTEFTSLRLRTIRLPLEKMISSEAPAIRAVGKQVIASAHEGRMLPLNELFHLDRNLRAFGDIPKIIVTPQDDDELINLISFTVAAKKPVCTGVMGSLE